MDKVFIFGHRAPDTDAVTGAISLSYLKYCLGVNAEPRVLGNVSSETLYALNKFNIKTPKYLNNVKVQIKDLDFNKNCITNENTSIIEAFKLMNDQGITGIPLVDDNSMFKGYVSLKEIASDMIFNESLYVDTSFDNLVKVLDAKSYYKVDDHIEGYAHATTFDDATFIKEIPLDRKSILIVGDRKQIIEHALKVGVKLIIMVHAKELSESQMKIAAQNNINIISANKSSFKVARVLCLANPIKTIKRNENCITFNINDYLSDFEETIQKYKHTNYPILNNQGICLGMLRTTDVKKIHRKQVILVDHNTKGQSVDGLNEADILEIIDHHNLGDIVTSKPINMRSMSVGSVNTIIYHMYQENNIKIPKDIAGLMLSGIISDTLCLNSPTTTDVDIKVANELARLADIDIKKYGIELLESGVSIDNMSANDIIYKDNKEYEINDNKISISQVFTTDFNMFVDRIPELVKELDTIQERHNYQICALYVTDFIKKVSYVIYSNNSRNELEVVYNTNELNQGYKIPDIVSRKKQIIPEIMDVFMN